jgi:alkanesulfonate monooxygenase SsuD/methylene tetrahydromethanopterin reductase-like flavin-dependent oxidoreductase (luciferase family)
MMQALEVYRTQFRPSGVIKEPYAMLGLNVFAADTDAEAQKLFTSLQQQFINLRRGEPGPVPPPVETMEGRWSEFERVGVERALACAVVGSRETVRGGLASFIAKTKADELMVTAQIYDHTARLRSFEIVAEVRDGLSAEQPQQEQTSRMTRSI